jgi:hypothetical protein
MSVYSIIPTASYCHLDMLRIHVRRRGRVCFLGSLQNAICLPFPQSVGLNTCVCSKTWLIQFDE